MPSQRLLAVASIAVLFGALLVACTSANPGWTYQPAPPVTPAPSVEGSAAPSASGGTGSGAVAISALNVAFEQASVTVPAGKVFRITFDNKDSGVPHNVAIHRDNASGAEVFKGEIVTGPATAAYDVPALDAGTYAFVCTVHASMAGTLTAQ